MDWMFKEHDIDGESSPVVDNQSTYDTPTNLGDTFAFVNDQTGEMMGLNDENLSAQPTLLIHEDGNAEDASTVVVHETSDSNDFVARSVDLKQPHGNKDVYESVCESSNMLKGDGSSETTSINCGVPVGGVEKVVEEVCEETSNKDKVVKLLREEVRICKWIIYSA